MAEYFKFSILLFLDQINDIVKKSEKSIVVSEKIPFK